ncbi:MAG: sigma-70 family RNA polymerase sigma factor [Clostridia bacterium]|nr:sigma-70 family RNA polymerase sigma factor [Clostridia bacterium]
MNDTEIVELFWARSEDAIRQTDAKYGKLCRRLADNLLHNAADAEECVNDAYLRVWNLIPEERPTFYQAFLCKIVKHISLDRIKYKTAKKRDAGGIACLDELETCIPAATGAPEDALDADALTGVINEFLKEQTDYARKIFLRRYWYCDSLQVIAADYGVKEAKISAQLFRTRAKLKEYLAKEGYTV